MYRDRKNAEKNSPPRDVLKRQQAVDSPTPIPYGPNFPPLQEWQYISMGGPNGILIGPVGFSVLFLLCFD